MSALGDFYYMVISMHTINIQNTNVYLFFHFKFARHLSHFKDLKNIRSNVYLRAVRGFRRWFLVLNKCTEFLNITLPAIHYVCDGAETPNIFNIENKITVVEDSLAEITEAVNISPLNLLNRFASYELILKFRECFLSFFFNQIFRSRFLDEGI